MEKIYELWVNPLQWLDKEDALRLENWVDDETGSEEEREALEEEACINAQEEMTSFGRKVNCRIWPHYV